jgi:hypothetical protein
MQGFVHELELVPEIAPSELVITVGSAVLRPTRPGRCRYRVGASVPVSGRVLDGEVRGAGGTIGRFRLALHEPAEARIQRPFVFGASGVVGRVAVELSTRHSAATAADWSHERARARAIATGRALGGAITAALKQRTAERPLS